MVNTPFLLRLEKYVELAILTNHRDGEQDLTKAGGKKLGREGLGAIGSSGVLDKELEVERSSKGQAGEGDDDEGPPKLT